MIGETEALAIHEVVLERFGGSKGVRDEGLMHSALERPWGGFGDMEFYGSPEEKAAAILESIVSNHPFIDGNKRTGYVLMRLLLLRAGTDIVASQKEKYAFVIKVASGEAGYDWILGWLKRHLAKP